MLWTIYDLLFDSTFQIKLNLLYDQNCLLFQKNQILHRSYLRIFLFQWRQKRGRKRTMTVMHSRRPRSIMKEQNQRAEGEKWA